MWTRKDEQLSEKMPATCFKFAEEVDTEDLIKILANELITKQEAETISLNEYFNKVGIKELIIVPVKKLMPIKP